MAVKLDSLLKFLNRHADTLDDTSNNDVGVIIRAPPSGPANICLASDFYHCHEKTVTIRRHAQEQRRRGQSGYAFAHDFYKPIVSLALSNIGYTKILVRQFEQFDRGLAARADENNRSSNPNDDIDILVDENDGSLAKGKQWFQRRGIYIDIH